MTEVKRTAAEDGSVTHVFRMPKPDAARKRPPRWSMSQSSSPPKSPMPRSPSMSNDHELARALITATTTGHSGHRMSVFGPFINEVPSRIGHNAALDSAVAVLVDAHRSLVHKKMASEILNPHLYLKAIKTLQLCLEDRDIGMSANTLCASVLLSLVEVGHINCSWKATTDVVDRLWQAQELVTDTWPMSEALVVSWSCKVLRSIATNLQRRFFVSIEAAL